MKKKKIRLIKFVSSKKINYGFIPDKIEKDHYIFGAGQIDSQILQLDGQWEQFLPSDEFQSHNDFESYNCTAYGSSHALATLHKKLFNQDFNKSERFIGIMANTQPPGNSPHTVCEAIRKNGLVEESSLPFSSDIQTLEQYYSPKPPTSELKKEGINWLLNYVFSHEWIFDETADLQHKQELMKKALQYSPLGVAVYAWQQDVKTGYYISAGMPNHWVTCYGYEDGKYWKIFDSYDSTHKQLAWNFNFTQGKRFHLIKKSLITSKSKSTWRQILDWFFKTK